MDVQVYPSTAVNPTKSKDENSEIGVKGHDEGCKSPGLLHEQLDDKDEYLDMGGHGKEEGCTLQANNNISKNHKKTKKTKKTR